MNVKGVKSSVVQEQRLVLDLHCASMEEIITSQPRRHRRDVAPSRPEIVGVVVLPLPEAAASLPGRKE